MNQKKVFFGRTIKQVAKLAPVFVRKKIAKKFKTMISIGLRFISILALTASCSFVGINFRENENLKSENLFSKVEKQQSMLNLLKEVNLKGGFSIRNSKEDDTYWDRNNRVIYLSPQKKNESKLAAIIFELCNACNEHSFTDKIETLLLNTSIKELKLTGPDFFYVAQEMEKDEFISLKNYKKIIDELNLPRPQKNKLRDKYIDIQNTSNKLDYDLFVNQNLSSGHTMDLAKLQFSNYTGLKPEQLLEILPLRLKQPSLYLNYKTGNLRNRSAQKIKDILEYENKNGLDTMNLTDFITNSIKLNR